MSKIELNESINDRLPNSIDTGQNVRIVLDEATIVNQVIDSLFHQPSQQLSRQDSTQQSSQIRIVGDVHGDLYQFLSPLVDLLLPIQFKSGDERIHFIKVDSRQSKNQSKIDEKNIRVIYLGDIFDRGQFDLIISSTLIKLIRDYQNQIQWLLGNHDLNFITSNLNSKNSRIKSICKNMIQLIDSGIIKISTVLKINSNEFILSHTCVNQKAFDQLYHFTIGSCQSKNQNQLKLESNEILKKVKSRLSSTQFQSIESTSCLTVPVELMSSQELSQVLNELFQKWFHHFIKKWKGIKSTQSPLPILILNNRDEFDCCHKFIIGHSCGIALTMDHSFREVYYNTTTNELISKDEFENLIKVNSRGQSMNRYQSHLKHPKYEECVTHKSRLESLNNDIIHFDFASSYGMNEYFNQISKNFIGVSTPDYGIVTRTSTRDKLTITNLPVYICKCYIERLKSNRSSSKISNEVRSSQSQVTQKLNTQLKSQLKSQLITKIKSYSKDDILQIIKNNIMINFFKFDSSLRVSTPRPQRYSISSTQLSNQSNQLLKESTLHLTQQKQSRPMSMSISKNTIDTHLSRVKSISIRDSIRNSIHLNSPPIDRQSVLIHSTVSDSVHLNTPLSSDSTSPEVNDGETNP